MLSSKEVQHVAKLARIALGKEESEKFKKELSAILDFVAKLKEVDISKTEPTFHSFPLKNIMRKDEVVPFPKEGIQRLIKLMPERKKCFLKVKSVLK